ncbi:MAG: 3-phosphoshikimate 1-carboxyvinyltransferase [Bacteroidetes bacterium]|nr:3-phosphoshikimate 1-carboxyvinyltransferase [Bacteroidota bacterium]
MKLAPTHTEVSGSVCLPGSKSISNRLLMMMAYAEENEAIEGLSAADDTVLLRKLLRMVATCGQSRIPLVIGCNNAGAVYRFLMSFLATKKGKWLLTGSPRMKQRPVGELVNALRQLGANITYTGKEGFPPLLIQGSKLTGGTASLNMSRSSQFASSLLMAGPIFTEGLHLLLTGERNSQPYLDMTMRLMQQSGIRLISETSSVRVEPGTYNLPDLEVEPDWSAAAFWYELVAIRQQGSLLLSGLKLSSLQGDKVTAAYFEKLGVQTTETKAGLLIAPNGKTSHNPIFELSDNPDIFPALTACCAAKRINATFCGIANLRIKESDRIAAMSKELGCLGASFTDSGNNCLKLETSKDYPVGSSASFDSWNDHRVAMALAPLALIFSEISIDHPEVVSKSYPDFWKQLEATGCVKLVQ